MHPETWKSIKDANLKKTDRVSFLFTARDMKVNWNKLYFRWFHIWWLTAGFSSTYAADFQLQWLQENCCRLWLLFPTLHFQHSVCSRRVHLRCAAVLRVNGVLLQTQLRHDAVSMKPVAFNQTRLVWFTGTRSKTVLLHTFRAEVDSNTSNTVTLCEVCFLKLSF